MLKLRTIAEGVEDASQCAQLHELGCDAGQGYLFGRPLEALEMHALLSAPAEVPSAAPGSVLLR